MIYTVIADFKRIEYLFTENSPVITDGAKEIFDSHLNAGEEYAPSAEEMREEILGSFPKEIYSIVAGTKNKALAHKRAGAYITLYNTLRHFLERDEIILSKTESGKPCLLNKARDAEINVKISLSHCDTLAAVSVSDEGEVGVDIEEKISEEREKRLSERFFESQSRVKERISPIYLLATLTEDMTSIFAEIPEAKLQISDTSDFSTRWTLSEALMKCDGRGFAAIGEVERLKEISSADTRSFTYKGKTYYISTVAKSL